VRKEGVLLEQVADPASFRWNIDARVGVEPDVVGDGDGAVAGSQQACDDAQDRRLPGS
jgi:hypothetical protein